MTENRVGNVLQTCNQPGTGQNRLRVIACAGRSGALKGQSMASRIHFLTQSDEERKS